MSNKDRKIADIFRDEPQKADEEIQSPELDPSDFDSQEPEPEPDEAPGSQEPTQEDTSAEEDSGASEGAAEDEPDENLSPEEQEKAEHIKNMKKEVAESLLKPDLVVALFDMLMSRLGTIANKSKKDDWKLDDEDKEIFEKLLTATMSEEGMAFWPAKYWILVAIVMIYGFKGFDVWDQYYSDEAKEDERKKALETDPAVKAKKAEADKRRVQDEVEELEDLVAMERKRKDLLEEIGILQAPPDNGKPDVPEAEAPATEEVTAEDVTDEDPPEEPGNSEKDEPSGEADTTSPPPEQIKPEQWKKYRHVYDGKGTLVRNRDGAPRKRPGSNPGTSKVQRDEKGKFVKK